MNKDLMFSSVNKEWETPKLKFTELNAKYSFTLDAAASDKNHKVDKYYTEENSCLDKDWSGETVFCNPPYSRQLGIWVKKFYEESCKPKTTVVALLPARTDTLHFHKYIYDQKTNMFLPGVKVDLIKGRLFFEIEEKPILDKKGKRMPAPFPSMVVEFKVHETLKESYPVIHDSSASTKTDMDYVNFFNCLYDEDLIKEYHEPVYKIVNRCKLKMLNETKK